MRRSKSNPAKYARNYRAISQRQMSKFDDGKEEEEIVRLETILIQSKEHLKGHESDGDEDPNNKKKKKKKRQVEEEECDQDIKLVPEPEPATNNSDDEFERARAFVRNSTAHLHSQPLLPETQDHPQLQPKNAKKKKKKTMQVEEKEAIPPNPTSTMLSKDFIEENPVPDSLENPLIVLSAKKKRKERPSRVELTMEEIKEAKKLKKNTERKLKQLANKAQQKVKRAVLYDKLQKTAIDAEEMKLMTSSSTLGKRVSKKELLKKLIHKERAGMELTPEERDLLYRDRPAAGDDNSESEGDPDREKPQVISRCAPKNKKQQVESKGSDNDKDASTDAASIAAQMMASLSNLKTASQRQKEETERKQQQEEEEQKRLEAERLRNSTAKAKVYRPSDPIVIQTAATNKKLQVHHLPDSQRRVVAIERPPNVQASRYDLPVAQMEFELMDAIRNNDVTIVCGETGSGKSTQVPQLLYESGFTMGSSSKSDGQDQKYWIGVTQPRRVAAVSTAKRVCYEMGQGDGKTIKSTKRDEGNLVAYQTRYESAGFGKRTGVKFMTDGILLQEIQSDLLLRKYSVIVLDECHERNLNCDILCGLIGLALPLRKKASQEPGSDIVELKLVIMSATLRVDDFTTNKKLFPSTTPCVIKIPGRTFPVIIHHSKLTEIVKYEDLAFQKVCKIHRKLPKGGILLFLTGKQEIVRMVNRLRKALSVKQKAAAQGPLGGYSDVVTTRTDITFANETGPRDMDDDEFDCDLLYSNADDDYDDEAQGGIDNIEATAPINTESNDIGDENIPKEVLVLPLYSMLSAEEQAKVFNSAPEGCRLIVVSTNIAETSITIPDIKYVVDTGRQKSKNYDVKTGVASFDISWISKAAANQRAGRAGRTGPGHCYRLYSSSMFSRHMDDFELPEVLTRPLEDVVLAMKAMNILSVSKFPFPTPPAESQVEASVKLLANLGCVSLDEDKDIDGKVTPLGAAISTFPLGVRCGKMLLVAAHAGVLDYAISIVAALSEKSPFLANGDENDVEVSSKNDEDENSVESAIESDPKEKARTGSKKWAHKSGDIYATMLAIGAYTYAGKGAGGISEKVACKNFCQENGLNHVIMARIQQIRVHLARLVKARMSGAEGVAAKTGKIPHSMKPPNKVQEQLLLQVIVSGMLDNVAMLAPLGSIPGSHPISLRSAFLSCSSSIKEPLFMDRNSVLYSRDSRRLPHWICYDYLVRKKLKDGTPIATMKNVTPVDASWLGILAKGSNLLSLGGPLRSPSPRYDYDRDEVLCSIETKFGSHNWEIPPIKMCMQDVLRAPEAKRSMHFQLEDTYRYFGRFLLEGKVIAELKPLMSYLNDSPSVMTSKSPLSKAGLIVSALADADIDSRSKLLRHWATVDNKFLFNCLKKWVKPEFTTQAKRLWINTVKKHTGSTMQG